MERLRTVLIGLLLVITVATISIVLALLAQGAEELASWVQAVGSIAALGIAIWVMSRQNKHAAQLVADADRIATMRRVRSVQAILCRYYSQLTIADYDLKTKRDNPVEKARVEQAVRQDLKMIEAMRPTLKEIPVFDIGSLDLADSVLLFIQAVDDCYAGLETMCQGMSLNTSAGPAGKFFTSIDIARIALLRYEEAADFLDGRAHIPADC